jgi:ABC-type uncharacterized transport system substrate-binding protein
MVSSLHCMNDPQPEGHMASYIGRRKFLATLGGAAAWPLAAGAQQPTMPVIGFLNSASPDGYASNVAAFHQGLKEAGYVDGQNATIEYRWAENHYDRLPALAADLVQQKVTVIAATTTPAALAAKAATSTVPIVFTTGGDPIKLGLVASLRRPGGNVTGSTQLSVEVGPKRLELARELFPGATTFALLVNPANPLAATVSKDLEAVADTLGMRLHVLHASTEADFEAAFATAAQLRAAALVISTPEPWFGSHAAQLGALALRHSVPAIYFQREFAAAGGLMSYGGSVTETYRLAGLYAGRILKGEKPADLPVVQSAKVELILNLKTARALGITVPLPLSGRADEVIE